ncbi:MAG: AAA family ATPase [Syntrophales bacterium]|nr:AAA family ATPase [Syntrophales bacterium]
MDKQAIENHFAGYFQTFYERYLPKLSKGKGDELKSVCPFHLDTDPSLSVNSQTGMFHCFGCHAAGSIFDFYARQNSLDTRADFPKILDGIAATFGIHNGDKQTTKPTVAARYDYQDESGKLVYQIERLEPKSFRIRRPDGAAWAYNAKGVKSIPYRLPEVLKADEVLIPEGEKDVDNLRKIGFTATTNPYGAGKFPDHFGPYFAAKHVVLIPHNDEPGRAHMKQVAAIVKNYAASIRWLDLPDLPEKGGDVSDWLAQYQDKTEAAERLSIMIEGAPEYREETETSEQVNRRFHFLSANDLCAMPKPTLWLLKPYIDAGSLAMIFGEAGSYKSFLSLDQGLCIATAHDWHGHEVRQRGSVFYIAGEGFAGINRRIKAWALYHETDLQDVPFFVSDRPAQFLDMESAGEVVRSVDELQERHGDPVLIIIDTLNRNFGPGDENSTADMTRFISTIDETLRSRYRCAVQVIHHSGLSATERARGASALRAALDWEYRLQKNADGSRILTCTKAKDHGEPPTICFMPETITLDGWIDPDDGEVMTSCVLHRVEGTTADTRPLSGARKVAFDALVRIGEDYVHIDTWRDAAYAAGVSPTSSQDAKRKAFKRAVSELRDAGLVEVKGDYWWVKADTGQRPDKGRTCPGT